MRRVILIHSLVTPEPPHRGLSMRTILAALTLSSLLLPVVSAALPVPAHDRIVILVMENKSLGVASVQPYAMSLMAQGATFNRSFAVAHPSQPNYFALFAGSTLGVTNDACPAPGS